MNESWTVEDVLVTCTTSWRQAGVPPGRAEEMRTEIEGHLREAVAAGKTPASVVGSDIEAFADSWAAVYSTEQPAPRPATTPTAEKEPRRRRAVLPLMFLLLAIAVAAVAVLAPKEDPVDDMEIWRWIWLGGAFVLGIGEMVTAGFFLLPFAIGAGMAGILAFFNVPFGIQIAVFLITSVLSLFAFRRLADTEDDEGQAVGALSYRNASGVVIETVDPTTGVGSVRVESEVWRATTDLGTTIPAGVPVTVLEVRGTRLVVIPRVH